MSPPAPRPYLFIVGAPRSGTTLLRRLLSHHPSVEVPHELRLLDMAGSIGWSVTHHGRTPTPGHHRASARDLAWGRPLVHRLMARLAEHSGASVVGDKYPPDAARIPQLAAVFENCRVIHIVRDGRDVVSSSLRAFAGRTAWRRSATPPGPAQMGASWVTLVQAARRDGRALGADRYLELTYEGLTAAPAQTGAAVLEFLKTPSHTSFSDALTTVRAGRDWRTTLSRAEVAILQQVSGFEATLAELGYPPCPTPTQPVAPDSPTDCLRRALDGPPQHKVAELSRAVRPPDAPDAAVAALLDVSDAPESLFAAMNARARSTPELRVAYARWMTARGLPARLARRLTGLP